LKYLYDFKFWYLWFTHVPDRKKECLQSDLNQTYA
jgi:hypothetical protein